MAGAPTEGGWNRTRAIERGVPESAAIAVERALYTRDEASNVAAGVFRALGLQEVPLPRDFATLGPSA